MQKLEERVAGIIAEYLNLKIRKDDNKLIFISEGSGAISENPVMLPNDYDRHELTNLICILREVEQVFKLDILKSSDLLGKIEIAEKLRTYNDLVAYVKKA